MSTEAADPAITGAAITETAGPGAVARLIGLLGGDPYAGYAFRDLLPTRQGWASEQSVLWTVVRRMRPLVIVEVGTWMGDSAIAMARELERLGGPGCVLCVDTWLGGVEHMLGNTENDNWLRLSHGHPQIYRQFIANVMHAGVQGRIVPVAQTSHIAARLFAHIGLRPQLVYIDASHDFIDVSIDLQLYWDVLAEGGVIVGDDYTRYWPGVIAAARQFAAKHGLPLVTHRGQFVLAKGANPAADLCAAAGETCWDPLSGSEVAIPEFSKRN